MEAFEDVEVGDKVRHPKFGQGTVMHKSGTGENAKVRVKFSAEFGEKRLVVKYAKLKRVGERPTLAAAPEGAPPPPVHPRVMDIPEPENLEVEEEGDEEEIEEEIEEEEE
jgi:hypothetical protein